MYRLKRNSVVFPRGRVHIIHLLQWEPELCAQRSRGSGIQRSRLCLTSFRDFARREKERCISLAIKCKMRPALSPWKVLGRRYDLDDRSALGIRLCLFDRHPLNMDASTMTNFSTNQNVLKSITGRNPQTLPFMIERSPTRYVRPGQPLHPLRRSAYA